MPRSFFKAGQFEQNRVPLTLVPGCEACGLYKGCRSPKIPLLGEGRRRILVVGEGPGETEDAQNQPFVGNAGQLLRQRLARLGVNLERDCWVSNSVICRPWRWETRDGKRFRANRPPKDQEIDFCRPNLLKVLKQTDPVSVILLGGKAVRSLVGWLWKPGVGEARRWVNWHIPSQQLNAWVSCAFHPSYVLREMSRHENRAGEDEPTSRLFDDQLRNALKKAESGRPWKEVPDYKAMVTLVHDPADAARLVRKMIPRGRPVAFDYETNMLKPDHPRAKIVSCAVSDGRRTYSYPWAGEVVGATADLLRAEVPKLGYNVKFEQRWSMKFLGVDPVNLVYDGMNGAHVIDNRRGNICSLKFQAFVVLGAGLWNQHLDSYLESEGGGPENRIDELSLDKLLMYGGIDALLEWEVDKRQMKLADLWVWDC